MRTLNIVRLLIFAFAFGLPAAPQAMLIAIYTLPGDSLPLEEVAALVRAARQNPDITSGDKLTVRVANSSVLTSDFSVPPGVSAYFWSDTTYGRAGFEMLGVYAAFDSEFPPVAPAVMDTVAQATDVSTPIVWVTAFQGVSMDSKRIQFRYTLSKAGPVSVEVYGMNGRRLGRWKWEESSSGAYQRSFDLNNAPRNAALVRWTFEDLQVIRKILGNRETAP